MEEVMAEVLAVFRFVGSQVLHILPYFILSILLAAFVNMSGLAKTRIEAFVGRHPLKMVVIAAALGVLSPFCSCGVIPIISGFLAAGSPIAPVFAFWIASPLMDPEIFVITWGELGISMAMARLVVAFCMGIIAGLVGLAFRRESNLREGILKPTGKNCDCSAQVSKGVVFLKGVLSMSLYLGKWLLVAFVLEAIIIRYVPTDWIRSLLGTQGPYSIVAASLIGLPLYLNGISAVPIVKGLMLSGMGKGAAIAFMISGPVTTLPAMVAVTAVARWRLFLAYLFIGFCGAVIAGYACQWFMG